MLEIHGLLFQALPSWVLDVSQPLLHPWFSVWSLSASFSFPLLSNEDLPWSHLWAPTSVKSHLLPFLQAMRRFQLHLHFSRLNRPSPLSLSIPVHFHVPGLALGSKIPSPATLPPSLTALQGLSVHLSLTCSPVVPAPFSANLSLDPAVSGPGVPPRILLLYLLTFSRFSPFLQLSWSPWPAASVLRVPTDPKMWGSSVCAAKLSSFILKQLQEHCYVSVQLKTEINKISFNWNGVGILCSKLCTNQNFWCLTCSCI